MIEETAERRAPLKELVEELAKQRTEFLREQVEAAGGASASLDYRLYGTILEQAKKQGIELRQRRARLLSGLCHPAPSRRRGGG